MSETTTMNFMGNTNFIPSNLTQLKLLVTCWFLGEPTYYIPSGSVNKKPLHKSNNTISNNNHLHLIQSNTTNTMEIFINVVNKALSENFEEVLKLAIEARNDYNMRSGPCAVLYYAIKHPNRQDFNKLNPLKLREYAKQILKIPTDAWMLFELWQQDNKPILSNATCVTGSDVSVNKKCLKKKLPTIFKKIIADHIESMSKYQMKKYLNKSHIIDLVRISHANPTVNPLISEIIKTGDLIVEETEQTWELLRSQQKGWKEIITTLNKVPHMALLRNLVGIIKDTNDEDYLNNIVFPMLKAGVKNGKQFPFRYLTCLEEVIKLEDNYKSCKVSCEKALNDCVEISMENFPILEGNTICLCDNSGSAWGTFPSQYGKQTVAKIANLSGIMTAKNCTGKGYVGVFGDTLKLMEIDKTKKILDQTHDINIIGSTVGASTENGIWIFFNEAFEEALNLEKEGTIISRESLSKWFDNIFIMSDMQCASGGLYGKHPNEYKDFQVNGNYIDGLKLIENYRKTINPKVNVYCVQVAGYNNTMIPEVLYRTHILSGWTSMETTFADKMNKLMDDMDNGIMSVTI